MRKLLALAMVAVFALTASAFAGDPKSPQTKAAMKAEKTDNAHGTISAWDDATKTFKVKDKDGKEMEFVWNENTKIVGTPKVGEPVNLHFTKDKDGKSMATHITVTSAEMGKEKAKKGQ